MPTTSGVFRILLVDDHPLVRGALGQLFSAESDFEVCGEAATLAEARVLCGRLRPDLVVLDLHLPDGYGLTLLKESQDWAARPATLVLTAEDEADPAASEAMRLGAAGFVSKRTDGGTLVRIARDVCGGKIYLNPTLLDQLIRRRHRPQEPRPPRRRREN